MTADAGWSAADMAQLTGGKWLVAPGEESWRTIGICADITQFAPGQMLLAFAAGAGLRVAIVERLAPQSAGIIAEDGSAYASSGVPVLEVPDLRKSVASLANAARLDFKGTVLGVTGSVGKTTTVAMARHVLAGIGNSDSSRTSANSPYGIGWNLASMRRDAQFWVQEMAIGRMDVCSHLVQPDVAIVTAIAPAHLDNFGTTDNIAALKARIYLGMKPGGIAVINRDMPECHIFETAALAAQLKVLRFGSSTDCEAQVLGSDRETVRAAILGKEYAFALGAPGHHMALNAVAVLAAVAALGLDVAAAARRFASFQPLAGRGKRSGVSFEGKRIEVWDDCYNANPSSMRAALQMMQRSDSVPKSSRVLVLGDMLGLGVEAQKLHLSLEQDIRAAEPDRVLLCGPLMQALADRLLCQVKGRWFANVKAMQSALSPWINTGDVVLVKASHDTQLDNIVKMLKTTPQRMRVERIQQPGQQSREEPGKVRATSPPRPFQRAVLPEIEAHSAISVLTAKQAGQAPERLFDKASSRRIPPASLTKLMTALVMLDLAKKYAMPLTDSLTIDSADRVGGSGLNVKASERITFRDALANLLLPSSNIAANAVARTFGQLLCNTEDTTRGDAVGRFIAEMQAKAVQLGLRDTQFRNPSGLPARGQLTTAADIAKLMLAVLQYPDITATWGKASHVMQVHGAKRQEQEPREQKICSTVKVINDYDVVGGKTGTLLPGCYHVAILSTAPNGEQIVTVVLRAPDQLALYTDLRRILDAVKRGRDWPRAMPA